MERYVLDDQQLKYSGTESLLRMFDLCKMPGCINHSCFKDDHPSFNVQGVIVFQI